MWAQALAKVLVRVGYPTRLAVTSTYTCQVLATACYCQQSLRQQKQKKLSLGQSQVPETTSSLQQRLGPETTSSLQQRLGPKTTSSLQQQLGPETTSSLQQQLGPETTS